MLRVLPEVFEFCEERDDCCDELELLRLDELLLLPDLFELFVLFELFEALELVLFPPEVLAPAEAVLCLLWLFEPEAFELYEFELPDEAFDFLLSLAVPEAELEPELDFPLSCLFLIESGRLGTVSPVFLPSLSRTFPS